MSHRKALTLEEKITLIKDNQNGHSLSVRELADKYKISKSSAALEMMRKLHLFASIEQPKLHNLISDLESQLTDIYLDSKAVKQSSITDYFSHC